MTIKSKWRLRRGGVWIRAPFPANIVISTPLFHGGGRLVVVTMWCKGAKWDKMQEIHILLRAEHCYGALFFFLVTTISKIHFEAMEQPNPNRVIKTENLR